MAVLLGYPKFVRRQWWLLVALIGGWHWAAAPCAAQTAGGASIGPSQAVQGSSGANAVTVPSSAAQSTAVQNASPQLPGTTQSSTPTPGIGQRTGERNIFASAPVVGRGLPGMPGGPPVNSPMGVRDPSSAFMVPRALGLLACDLAVNPDCLTMF